MGDIIVVGIILILVFFALRPTIAHFKGQGDCCGGGGGEVRENKKLTEPKLGEKLVKIEGMHCEHCRNSVEHAVNQIDGAACKVSLRKNIARIAYSRELSDDEIRAAIEKLDFKVVEIN